MRGGDYLYVQSPPVSLSARAVRRSISHNSCSVSVSSAVWMLSQESHSRDSAGLPSRADAVEQSSVMLISLRWQMVGIWSGTSALNDMVFSTNICEEVGFKITFCDLSKAFECIDQCILLRKLHTVIMKYLGVKVVFGSLSFPIGRNLLMQILIPCVSVAQAGICLILHLKM